MPRDSAFQKFGVTFKTILERQPRKSKYKVTEDNGLIYDFTNVSFFRGKFHLLLVALSPIWVFLLFQTCTKWLSTVAVVITTTCAFVNFASSALLHSFKFPPKMTKTLHDLDYIGIFLMISGSAMPIAVLLLNGRLRVLYLLLEWVPCFTGIFLVLSNRLSKFSSAKRTFFFVIIGLFHALFFIHFASILLYTELLLSIGLAVSYIIGATFFAMKWPESSLFGYHEIFHSFCFFSAICTFLLDYSILLRAG